MIQDPDNPFLCPQCRRRFQHGAERCVWCGASLRDVKTPPREMDCPTCGRRLDERSEGDMRIFACADCQGVWMDKPMIQKLEALYKKAPAAPPAASTSTDQQWESRRQRLRQGIVDKGLQAGYRKCPICGEYMARRRYRRVSDVIIDECLGHGVWFDADELNIVVDFLNQGGLQASKAFEEAGGYNIGSAARSFAIEMRSMAFLLLRTRH